MRESLRRGEGLALQDGDQGAVRADQAGQSLGSATARHDAEQDLGLADEEVAVGHHPQVVGPRELGAQAQGRTVEGGDEDDAASVHLQERLVQALELDRRPQRCVAQRGRQAALALFTP